jgi:UPF0755 protein
VTNGVGGGPRDDRGAGRYAPSQADLRDPVIRARSAREMRGEGGGPGRGVRGLGLLAGCLIIAGATVVVSLVLATTLLRPVVGGWVTGMAYDNPSLLGIGFVANLVRDDLGPALTQPAGTDATEVSFTVQSGDHAASIAQRLADAGLVKDPRAFVFLALENDLSTRFQTGDFMLKQTMTPEQIASALTTPPSAAPTATISIRTGLRLEQVAALIEAQPADTQIGALTKLTAQDFLGVARSPSAALLKDYPWLKLPKDASLEGYLAAGDYALPLDATADDLVRAMLDRFEKEVGADRMDVPASRGLTWTQVLTMASMVEQEVKLESEKAKVAGVLQNRLDPATEAAGFLGSDPTVLYAIDTVRLSKLPLAKWPTFVFWTVPKNGLPDSVPADVAAYDTYHTAGLPPGPISTPTVSSIDAALHPDTRGGYLFFLARPDGTTVFAKTYAEHQKNIAKYMK